MEIKIEKEEYYKILKLLHKPVSYSDSFLYDKEEVGFKVTSENGLEFFNDGLNNIHRSGFLKCYSNDKKREYDIFYQYWIVSPESKSIFFFHGNAENSSTHPKLFYYLLINNYNIFTFDNIGHGSSSGLRGSIEYYSDYLDIADQVFQFYNNTLKSLIYKKNLKNLTNINLDWFIFGFSFGGLLAADFGFYIKKELNKDFQNEKFLNKKDIDGKKIKDVNKKDNKDKYKINESDTKFHIATNIIGIFLFSPWFSTHKRLINIFTKIYLIFFHPFFKKDKLMNLKLQKEIFTMNDESYININKNLTDNIEFLKVRKKDTRIFRVISKRRLAEIYKAQRNLRKIKNNYNISIYGFIPEKDFIVDSEVTKNNLQNWNGEFTILPECYHDFFDYDDYRWNNFSEKLILYLTKIVK